MVNEAELRDRLENPIDFTVADGTGIEKGALLKITDPRTASLADAVAAQIAGIAAREKVASDGRTRLAVFRRGVFDMVASGAIVVGQAVQSAYSAAFPNTVMTAAVTSSGACVIGHALETASDAERIQIFVNIGAGGNQIS
jgi:hypothetical protein